MKNAEFKELEEQKAVLVEGEAEPAPSSVETEKPPQNQLEQTTKTSPPPNRAQAPLEARYLLGDLLGEGGMSQVFSAQHKSTHQTVAIKKVRPERLKDEKNIQRFIQECETIKNLHHSNIIQIHEYGIDETGAPYLVMDKIEGLTLAELLKQEGALDTDRALSISVQILKALEYAHKHGVIHRDIKPSNIMLHRTAEGKDQVFLLDFGIAKVFEHLSSAHSPLTETGQTLGTPWYMSPELCFGKEADERSDVYQSACVIYELLTGKKAFDGPTAFDIMFKHINENPDLSQLDSNMAEILSNSLSKNQEDRYQNVALLRKEIEEIQELRQGKDAQKSLLRQVESASLFQITWRRLAAAGLDAYLTGSLSAVLVGLLAQTPKYYRWENFQLPPDEFWASFISFFLGAANSVFALPSAIAALVPYSQVSDHFNFMLPLYRFEESKIAYLLTFLVAWLYFALFENSSLRGTPGKIVFGLKIQTAGSSKLSFGQVCKRFFGKFIEGLILPEMSRMVVDCTKRKRSFVEQLKVQLRIPLKDQLSQCVVVRTDRKASRPLTILAITAWSAIITWFALPWLLLTTGQADLLLSFNPSFAPALEAKADESMGKGQFSQAANLYAKAESVNPKRHATYEKHMAALALIGKYDAASSLAEQASRSIEQRYQSQILKDRIWIESVFKKNIPLALSLANTQKQDSDSLLEMQISRGKPEFKEKLQIAHSQYESKKADRQDTKDTDANAKRYNHIHPDVFVNNALVELELNNLNDALDSTQRALSDYQFRLKDKKCKADSDNDAIAGSIHLVRAKIFLKKSEPLKANEELKLAKQFYDNWISQTDNAPRTIREILYRGQNYLCRAEVLRLLGDAKSARLDEETAKKYGANVYLDGAYPD